MENSNNHQKNNEKIYVRTPLIESVGLRKHCDGRQVFLKLENCQPSGSFKLRGISNLCKRAILHGYKEVVCPSGGNAGLATAFAAMKLNLPCHIIVNRKSPSMICDTIRSYGATVEVFGDDWEESNKHAIETVTNSKRAFLVHPFDHPDIWDGHSTIVDEIAEDLNGQVPSLIVACCGGGGLVSGIVQGIRRQNWEKRTKILAMETAGTHSFHLCVKEGGQKVRLDKFTSIVHCLAANEVCDQVLKYFNENKPQILSRLVTDTDAAEGCIRFANDHRFLVGLACGTTIAAVYKGIVQNILTHNEGEYDAIYDKEIDFKDLHNTEGPVVVIVCGGAEISLKHLQDYREKFNLHKYF